MRATRDPGAMLRTRQVAALRESLRYDLVQHPDWADLMNQQGLLAAYEGDFEKAKSSFSLALETNPDYASARWNARWTELLAEGAEPAHGGPDEVENAVQPPGLFVGLRSYLRGEVPPPDWGRDDPRLAFVALTITARSGSDQDFASALETARGAAPWLDDLLKTASLWSDGPDRPALAEIGRPDRANPGYADLLERAGRFESIAGRDEEALRLFALSALLRGDRAVLLVEQAEILSRRGRNDAALGKLQEAVEASPDWHRGHLAMAYELSVRGRNEEALPHAAKAARLRPGYADVQYQYALLLHSTQRNDEAIGALEASLALNPGYLVARVAVANLLFESGREGKAAPHFERVLEEGFRTGLLTGRFGYSMHKAGHRRQAEEIFLQAITSDHDRAEILCLYGSFLAETDRALEARAIWSRALATDPPEDIRSRLESLLLATAAEEFPEGDE